MYICLQNEDVCMYMCVLQSGKPVLHTATNFGLDMVIFFVDHGADVNVTDEVNVHV